MSIFNSSLDNFLSILIVKKNHPETHTEQVTDSTYSENVIEMTRNGAKLSIETYQISNA